MPSSEITIRQIEPGDKLAGFSVGDPAKVALKTFLKKEALKFHRKGLARTYVAVDAEKVIGYITLVCGQIGSAPDLKVVAESDDYKYEHFPAIKIARLAVDKKYRSRGLGRKLTNLALGIVKEDICPKVGCMFMVVDSKSNAVSFYEKCGFTMLNTKENRDRSEPIMFINLHKIEASAPAPVLVEEVPATAA